MPSKTKKIYWPYIVGNDSPISNLFENIYKYIIKLSANIITFRNTKNKVLSDPSVSESYVRQSKPYIKKFKYLSNSLQKYDLIHTGGKVFMHFPIARLVRARNPSVDHIHTFRVDVDPDSKFNTDRRRRLASMADVFTAVSENTAETVAEHFGYRPKVIYNGVDTQEFHPNYEEPSILQEFCSEKPLFIYVGSFSARKRPKDVVQVAKAVQNAEFVMIGDGELYTEIKSFADPVNNIRLTGRLEKEKLPAIYANATGLIFPTVREGCPNVVLEAMASGTPIIGYEATSMPELVTDGKTGYLRPVDDIEGLADAVQLIIKDETNELGQRAREYIEDNHTFEQIAKEYVSLYKTVLGY